MLTKLMLTKLIPALIALLLPALNCAAADREFEQLADEFLTGYFAFHPQTAISLGLHEIDGRLPDLRRESLARERARLQSFDRRLDDFPVNRLSPATRLDFEILRTGVREELFPFDVSEAFTRNPLTYVKSLQLEGYLVRNYAPLEARVRSLIAAERQIPGLLAAARENLQPVLPRPFVETAIKVATGAADFLVRDLPDATRDLRSSTLAAELREASELAARELRQYATWLESERLPQAHHRFALGRERFVRMLRDQEVVSLPPEEILELGRSEIRREQAAFEAAARQIDASRPALDVFRTIQNDHPTADNLIPDTRRNLEAIRDFVLQRRLISIPSDVRVIVAETPRFRRATSFASMSSPGPFETKSTEAYYYVTPAERSWSPEKQHEWLTAFNYYTTDVVSIHEAYPGHYVQHLHLNAAPVHRLRKVFTSYAFVEGWAHYTEQMVIDEGFSGPGPADPVRAAKYRMAQADESLLRLCRLCASIQMHCGDMSVDDATRLFQEQCHYQEQPARQEATRGTYDPGYLHYALGKLMILKLRRDWQRQEGERFSMQRFHDELLRHGAPPLPLLRRALLKDERTWDASL